MANPFLVLGGIAVGIVTAAFGILQVPGWIGAAQDAAAQNDLANAAAAQAAHVSERGSALTSTQAAKTSGGLQFQESSGVNLEVFGAKAQWGVIATSVNGHAFARISGLGQTLRGDTRSALLADPAFVKAWADAGLPQPPAAAGEQQSRGLTFYRQAVGGNGELRAVLDQSASGYGMFSWTEAGGQGVIAAAIVNGVSYPAAAGGPITKANIATFATQGAFAEAWKAAGLGSLSAVTDSTRFATADALATFFAPGAGALEDFGIYASAGIAPVATSTENYSGGGEQFVYRGGNRAYLVTVENGATAVFVNIAGETTWSKAVGADRASALANASGRLQRAGITF